MPQDNASRIVEKVFAFARGEPVDYKALAGDVGCLPVGQYRVIVRNGNQIFPVLDAISRQQAYARKETEKWK